MPKLISIVVPIYNEEKNIPLFYSEIQKVLSELDYDFEFVFVNDGSQDGSIPALEKIAGQNKNIGIIDFSRNFGKEIALSAGIGNAKGDAILMIDADLQHPIEKIPEFLKKWDEGAEVVVGLREKNHKEGLLIKAGSYLFYKMMDRISDMEIVSRTTDFRLIDRAVADEFNKLSEKNRMTRALLDWLGFRRVYINFEANPRINGEAGYSFFKKVRLAFNSVVSFSLFPLRLAGYLGIIITIISGALGIFMFIANYVMHAMDFSGPAVLAVVILFLIGIVLICLGFIALYIANIHTEVINRPLYIIRKKINL